MMMSCVTFHIECLLDVCEQRFTVRASKRFAKTHQSIGGHLVYPHDAFVHHMGWCFSSHMCCICTQISLHCQSMVHLKLYGIRVQIQQHNIMEFQTSHSVNVLVKLWKTYLKDSWHPNLSCSLYIIDHQYITWYTKAEYFVVIDQIMIK